MSTPAPHLSASVLAARAFAERAHGDQRYGAAPYVAHLDAVAGVLLRFRPDEDEELLAAAYLHDVVEDTAVTLPELQEAFGYRVAELVHAVTSEPGETRKERHGKTWPKVVETEGALRLKLADRIANVEACWDSRSRLLFMYWREHVQFRGALWGATSPLERAMWVHLDTLLGWEG